MTVSPSPSCNGKRRSTLRQSGHSWNELKNLVFLFGIFKVLPLPQINAADISADAECSAEEGACLLGGLEDHSRKVSLWKEGRENTKNNPDTPTSNSGQERLTPNQSNERLRDGTP